MELLQRVAIVVQIRLLVVLLLLEKRLETGHASGTRVLQGWKHPKQVCIMRCGDLSKHSKGGHLLKYLKLWTCPPTENLKLSNGEAHRQLTCPSHNYTQILKLHLWGVSYATPAPLSFQCKTSQLTTWAVGNISSSTRCGWFLSTEYSRVIYFFACNIITYNIYIYIHV